MSQRNSNQKSKRLLFQPSTECQQLHDSDSYRTVSASLTSNALDGGSPTPDMTTTPPTHNLGRKDQMIFINPIGTDGFEPFETRWKIIDSITRYFPEAVKTFKSAPQSMKDIWFNEFKKSCKWNPEDEATVQKIFETKGARRLSDTLGQVRANLAKGKAPPQWMDAVVLAQYQSIWDKEEFKKTFEKNKKIEIQIAAE